MLRPMVIKANFQGIIGFMQNSSMRHTRNLRKDFDGQKLQICKSNIDIFIYLYLLTSSNSISVSNIWFTYIC